MAKKKNKKRGPARSDIPFVKRMKQDRLETAVAHRDDAHLIELKLALGYGVRYGAYKVDHPNTRDEEPETLPEGTGKCLYCGALFSKRDKRHRRLYCGDECRTKYCNRKSNLQRASRAEF